MNKCSSLRRLFANPLYYKKWALTLWGESQLNASSFRELKHTPCWSNPCFCRSQIVRPSSKIFWQTEPCTGSLPNRAGEQHTAGMHAFYCVCVAPAMVPALNARESAPCFIALKLETLLFMLQGLPTDFAWEWQALRGFPHVMNGWFKRSLGAFLIQEHLLSSQASRGKGKDKMKIRLVTQGLLHGWQLRRQRVQRVRSLHQQSKIPRMATSLLCSFAWWWRMLDQAFILSEQCMHLLGWILPLKKRYDMFCGQMRTSLELCLCQPMSTEVLVQRSCCQIQLLENECQLGLSPQRDLPGTSSDKSCGRHVCPPTPEKKFINPTCCNRVYVQSSN